MGRRGKEEERLEGGGVGGGGGEKERREGIKNEILSLKHSLYSCTV